jgi:hypothetical protein
MPENRQREHAARVSLKAWESREFENGFLPQQRRVTGDSFLELRKIVLLFHKR